MEWRIIKRASGYWACKGIVVAKGDVLSSGLKDEEFLPYEEARYDTRRQAEKYIERRQAERVWPA